MIIILSQKIDNKSSYSDEVFKIYHYPSRYRNQIKVGDTFVYYQGNRYKRNERYYFGTGRIEAIHSVDEDDYYAVLTDCIRFDNKVPIYLPEGGYVEQIDYQTVRKSINPPWQTSIRPISQKAYDYIISIGLKGVDSQRDSFGELKKRLQNYVRLFYDNNQKDAIFGIEQCSIELAEIVRKQKQPCDQTNLYKMFVEYCKTTKMNQSYKPVLILAFLSSANDKGRLAIEDAITFFKQYYFNRKYQGKKIEKGKSVFLKDDLTEEQIGDTIVSNPIKALCNSTFFEYDHSDNTLVMQKNLWEKMGNKEKIEISQICLKRLDEYYNIK